MSSLKLFRNTARQTLVAAAARVSPFSNAAVRRNVAPALWARSFASGGGFLPKEEVLERVSVVVKNFQNVDPAKVTATSHFMNDLGLDSLDTVEVRASHPQRLSQSTAPPAERGAAPPSSAAGRRENWRPLCGITARGLILSCFPVAGAAPGLPTAGFAAPRAGCVLRRTRARLVCQPPRRRGWTVTLGGGGGGLLEVWEAPSWPAEHSS